jgi:hypothetical protein
MCLSQLGITQSTTRFAEWALLFCLQPLPQNLKNQNQYIVLKITCKYVNTKDIVPMCNKMSYLSLTSRMTPLSISNVSETDLKMYTMV